MFLLLLSATPRHNQLLREDQRNGKTFVHSLRLHHDEDDSDNNHCLRVTMLFIVTMFVDDIWTGGGNIMHILQDYLFMQIRMGDKGLFHSFPFSLHFTS